MKTACCGHSLRSITLILLYFNVVGMIWGLLTYLTDVADSSYNQFFRDGTFYYLDVMTMIIGAVIFICTIVSISKEKPSIPLLTASVVYLVFEVLYMVYTIIVLNSNDALKETYDEVIEKQIKEHSPKNEKEYRELMNHMYSGVLFLVYAAFLVSIAIKLYAAMVIYSYKVDLLDRPVYSAPPRETADDKEANTSAPAGHNIQFATPQYPSQPMHYPTQPVQYPTAYQYADQPPSYPSQPAVYPPGYLYPDQPPQYSAHNQYPAQLPQYPIIDSK